MQRIDTIIQYLLSNGDISWWLELQVNGTALCLADGLHLKGIGGVGPVRLQLEHCTSGHHRAYTQQLPHKEYVQVTFTSVDPLPCLSDECSDIY